MTALAASAGPPLSATAPALAAWLLTLLADSTLLLAAAWVLGRTVLRDAPAKREFAWRAAIGVALLAPFVQMGLGRSVELGRLAEAVAAQVSPAGEPAFPSAAAAAGTSRDGRSGPRAGRDTARREARVPAEARAGAGTREGHPSGERPLPAGRGKDPLASGGGMDGRPAGPTSGLPTPRWFAAPLAASVENVVRVGVALWLLAAAAGLLTAAWRHSRFLSAVAPRRPVDDRRVRGLLDRLPGGRSVTLTGSGTLPAPATLSRREICVPWPRFAGLAAEQQRTLLAHELAHVRRNDPIWRWLASLPVAAFPFQPLFRVARRELRETSELLADEEAVRLTRAPGALAEALGQVARWLGPRPSGPAVAALGRRSELVRRVRAILTTPRDGTPRRGAVSAPVWGRWTRGSLLAAALASVALSLPAIVPVRAAGGMHGEGPTSARRAPGPFHGSRDSAGVVIIDNFTPLFAAGRWRVADRPTVRCPDVAGPAPSEGRIVDLVPLGSPGEAGVVGIVTADGILRLCEGGRITASLDGGATARADGRDAGSLVRSARGATAGPGDSLVVYSFREAVLLAPDGSGSRRIALDDVGDGTFSMFIETPRGLAANRFLDGRIRVEAGDGSTTGIALLEWSGEERGRIGPVPWTTSLETITSVSVWDTALPFVAEADAYWYASRDTVELHRFTAEGLERIVRAPHRTVPITAAHRRIAVQRMTGEWGFPPDVARRMPASDRSLAGGSRAPAVLDLLIDDRGCIWVRMPESRPGHEPRTWRVFEPDGWWVTDVRVPAGFDLHAIRGERIYGVMREPGRAESVEVRRLIRGS